MNGVNAKGITPDKRNRIQFRFWLDANKSDERQMIQDLEHFKCKRQYAASIRKALALFFSLMLGDLSILKELFPSIVEAVRADSCAALLAENAKLKQQIIGSQNTIGDTAIQKQLSRLEELLIKQGNVPVAAVGLKGGGLGAKAAAPPPTFDDDDDVPVLTISKTKSTVNANQNLINAMLNLGGGHANN